MASRKTLSPRAWAKARPGQEALPTGVVVGYGTLFTLLGAIIAYSAVNAGVGDHSSLSTPSTRSAGLHHDHGLARNHIDAKSSTTRTRTRHRRWVATTTRPRSPARSTRLRSPTSTPSTPEHGASGSPTTRRCPRPRGDPDEARHRRPRACLSPYPGLKGTISLSGVDDSDCRRGPGAVSLGRRDEARPWSVTRCRTRPQATRRFDSDDRALGPHGSRRAATRSHASGSATRLIGAL